MGATGQEAPLRQSPTQPHWTKRKDQVDQSRALDRYRTEGKAEAGVSNLHQAQAARASDWPALRILSLPQSSGQSLPGARTALLGSSLHLVSTKGRWKKKLLLTTIGSSGLPRTTGQVDMDPKRGQKL